MGPSGSGKSTLLNLIAGIDTPDSGRLAVEGIDITGMREAELARWRADHVGFIFQFYNLMPVLSAFENIELPLLLTRLNGRERREHVELVLELVGLADRSDHYPAQLSGGQQQRVAIARAVVSDPTIIMVTHDHVAANRFVTAAAAQAGADANTMGVSRTAAAANDVIPVDVLGSTVIECGAAFSKGDTLKSDGWQNACCVRAIGQNRMERF